MTTVTSLGFVGLGVMGGPMARHLAQKGHDVTVWNRTSEKAHAWVAKVGINSGRSPVSRFTTPPGRSLVASISPSRMDG